MRIGSIVGWENLAAWLAENPNGGMIDFSLGPHSLKALAKRNAFRQMARDERIIQNPRVSAPSTNSRSDVESKKGTRTGPDSALYASRGFPARPAPRHKSELIEQMETSKETAP